MLWAIIECVLLCCGLSSSSHRHVVGYHRVSTAMSCIVIECLLPYYTHRHLWPFGDDFQSLLATGRLLEHSCFGKFQGWEPKIFQKLTTVL